MGIRLDWRGRFTFLNYKPLRFSTRYLSDIRPCCKGKDIKVTDFFCEVAEEKVAKDQKWLMILYMVGGQIEKVTIDSVNYDITLADETVDMRVPTFIPQVGHSYVGSKSL